MDWLKYPKRLYIDGRFVDPTGDDVHRNTNPADGELLAEVRSASAADVDAAVAAAAGAFPIWRATARRQRAAALRPIGAIARRRREELASRIRREQGHLYQEALDDDMTAFGRQEEWEDSPEGYPQTPPYEWWNWHDEYEHSK